MAENGYGSAGWRNYEDYTSLKKHINKEKGTVYHPDYCYEIQKLGRQTTTGSDAEFQTNAAITTTEPTKTEVTVLLYGDADNASTNGDVYTLVYKFCVTIIVRIICICI